MRVDIENVQCIIKSTYEFPDLGLALIFGDNSVGKSSIIRAIAAAISYDDLNRDSRISEEQKLLGILKDNSKSNLGLIRVGSDEARIKLKGNLIDKTAIISRNGKFRGASPRFVITNVLSDVSWIMRILTHTTSEKISDYLKGFNDVIPRYDDIIDRTTETKEEILQKILDLKRMIKETSEAQKKGEEMKKVLELNRETLKALQEKISEEAKKDPNKKERVSEINSQIKEKERSIAEVANNIEEKRKALRNHEATIAQKKNEIDQKYKQIENFKKILEEYNRFDFDVIPEIEDEITNMKEKRYKEQVLYDILKRTHNMLEEEHSNKVLCPLCGSSEIDPEQVKRIATEKDIVIRTFDSKISELSRRIGDLKEKSKRKEYIQKEITGLEPPLERDKDDLKLKDQEAFKARQYLQKYETEKSDLEKKRDALQIAISEENSDDTEKMKSIQAEIRKLESNLKDIEMSKKYLQINIFGTNYPVESKTLNILEKGIMPSLSDIESHFRELIEKEKNKLKDEFNRSIKDILKEMSFDLDIYVDDNFNILSRKKTDNGYKILETQNLARSEQATIALTLQLALADIYSPNIPLILCDGVYEYFDEERRQKVLTYADEFGKKTHRTIIMTVVKKGINRPVVGLP
jgi:DNA repair exonuclease SbcCD ATPase subunit